MLLYLCLFVCVCVSDVFYDVYIGTDVHVVIDGSQCGDVDECVDDIVGDM